MLEIFALTAAESVLNTVKEIVLRNGGFIMFCIKYLHCIVFRATQEQFDKMVVDYDKLLEEERA